MIATKTEILELLRGQLEERTYKHLLEEKVSGRFVATLGRTAQNFTQKDDYVSKTLGDYVSKTATLGAKGLHAYAKQITKSAYTGETELRDTLSGVRNIIVESDLEGSCFEKFTKAENALVSYGKLMDSYVDTLTQYGIVAAADEAIQREVMQSVIPSKEQYIELYNKTMSASVDLLVSMGEVKTESKIANTLLKSVFWTSKQVLTSSSVNKRNLAYVGREANRIYGA